MEGSTRSLLAAATIALAMLAAACSGPAPAPRSAGVSVSKESRDVSLAAGPVTEDAPSRPVRSKRVVRPDPRRAVVVGVNHARGSSRLVGAVGDAKVLRDALYGYGVPAENVTVLLEKDATRAAILDSIRKLAAQTPEGGRAVFAFAGHTRRRDGQNQIVTADGRLISANELGNALARVRAPMWVALPTCYAAGFDVPGVTGPGRVATFASGADQLAYEALSFGKSFLFEYLVNRAMVHQRAPESVEAAFKYAKKGLGRDFPERTPLISDGFEGDFVLGSLPRIPEATPGVKISKPGARPDRPGKAPAADEAAAATPSPRPPRQRSAVKVCYDAFGIGCSGG